MENGEKPDAAGMLCIVQFGLLKGLGCNMEFGLVVRVMGEQTVFTFDNEYSAVELARGFIHVKGIETAIVFKEYVADGDDKPIYYWSAVDGLIA